MLEPDKDQESKGFRRAKGSGSTGDDKDGGASLFLHRIVIFAPAHFALAPAPAQPVF